MAIPGYTVRIKDLAGATIIDAPARNLTYSFSLNSPGGCDFTMPLMDTGVTQANLAPMKREVHILRGAATVWGGYLWSVTASTEQNLVRCAAEGWFSKLHRRVIEIDKIYELTEQFDLVWDLINYTQSRTNGAMGITRGAAAASGKLRKGKFRYWERRVIGEVIEDFAQKQNGFDFEITADKIWKVYFPRKGSLIADDFELGVNVHGIALDIDGTNIATDVHAIGSGERNRTCIAVATDATAQAAYRLLETVIDFQDIKHFDDLNDQALRHLSLHKGPRVQPQVSVVTDAPPWGNYSVGDTATVIANRGFLTFNSNHRIIAIVVQVTNAGNEIISVHFDELLAP